MQRLAIAPGLSGLSGLSGMMASSLVYLLRDQFTTNASAPLASPRTCEPGGGTLTISDAGNRISIVSSALRMSGGALNWTDTYAYGDAQTRAAGLSFGVKVNKSGNSQTLAMGWVTAGNPDPTSWRSALRISTENYGNTDVGNNAPYLFDSAMSSTWYRFHSILRSTGSFIILGGNLLWVDNNDTTTPMIPIATNFSNAQCDWDDMAVVQLGSPWSTDYGIATSYVASPTNPQAATMAADGIVEFTWTPAASEVLELDVRKTDADNRWIIRCAQAGSTVKIIQRAATVETQRGTAAQTWTVGTKYRIVVSCLGNIIFVVVNNTLKTFYASASFNNTATGVNVAGFATGETLAAFPRDVSSLIPAGA